jgi:hypothetical protein
MRLGDLVRGWDGAGLWVKGNNHVKFVASMRPEDWKTRIRRVRVRVRGDQEERLADPPLWEIRWPDGASARVDCWQCALAIAWTRIAGAQRRSE